MGDHGVRLSGAMALLALLWVGVYWWWEPVRTRPEISIDIEPAPEPSVIRDPLGPPSDASAPTLVVNEPVLATSPSEPEPPSIIPPEFRSYAVRSGDTFERIAERELGSRQFAGAIARANSFVDPRRLRVGREIRIPIDPTNIQGKPADEAIEAPPALASVEYVVQRNDTLSRIASRVYGSSQYADELFNANRGVLGSPDDLRIGQTLELPPLANAPRNPGS